MSFARLALQLRIFRIQLRLFHLQFLIFIVYPCKFAFQYLKLGLLFLLHCLYRVKDIRLEF